MSKLIDAEAAKNCIEVKPEDVLSKWQEGYLAASMSAAHQIELLPDASAPLRAELEAKDARIKELERALAYIIKCEDEVTVESIYLEDRQNFRTAIAEAKFLLKGVQNA